MADDLRIQVSADTSRMEADISNAARRAQVTIVPTINARGLDAISRPLGKITGQADEFTKSMEAANARVLAFGASVGVLNAVAKAFGSIVSSSIEVERVLTEISVTSGEVGKNLDSLGKGIFNIAKLTGTSFKDAANAALEFSRQGAGMEESLKRAQAALVLTRTTGLDAAESVRGLTAAVSSFNDVGLDYERVVNKLAAVDTKFAVSSKDLIEGITRSASVAQEAGVSFDELTALITTLQEKTARGGAVIGNALKTIFTRVQSTENLDLLRNLGIAVNDIEGNILPATIIIKKLASEIQNLDDATRKSVLIKIGGGFQIDKLGAVLKDVADANGVFARSLTESQTAANQAFIKVEQLGKTTGAAFDKLVLSSSELASNIGKIGLSDNLKNILGSLDSVVGSINKAITGGDEGETVGNKLAQGIIAGIGKVISGPGLLLALGVGLKLLTNFGKFLSDSIQTQLGVNSAKKEQATLEKDIFSALTRNQDVQSTILSLEGNKAKQAEYILGIYKQQAAFLEKMSAISKSIAPVLYEGGIRSSAEGVKDVKKAAGGYMPMASAIMEEKRNAPAGSRIIVDKNFPMGGGKRGTMVYNSNETRVPNFAGTGGDAIIPNYRPRSAARGYVPNFANPAVNTTGLGEIVLDASKYSIAGLTIGGQESTIRARFKRENFEKAVKNDPVLLSIFQKYGAFGVDNVPVGNVYRRENENLSAIKAKEEDIKNLFKARANATLSPQIGEFLKQELDYLKIKPTAAMALALKQNKKFDFINDQTAGNFFEIILKGANMDFLDDNWGQFTASSGSDERSSFDIYNLKSKIAKEYGLPEKEFGYVEVKATKADLVKDLSRKTINELLKGGPLREKFLADYGGAKSAAGGYIPNFAKRKEGVGIMGLASKGKEFKDGDFSIEGALPVLAGRIFESKLKKLNYVNLTENSEGADLPNGVSIGELSQFDPLYKGGPVEAKLSGKGALRDSNFGKNKSKGNVVILPSDSSTDSDKELKEKKEAIILRSAIQRGFLFERARWLNEAYKNEDSQKIDYKKLIIPNSDPSLARTASSGYIPNFAKQLTGTGAGMLYQDPDFTEIGGGQTGKFLAPKSGQGFGQKIFYKAGNEKISQEYNVNKALSDFESQNPTLFKENAISFTKVGQLLNRGELLAGFERELINESGVDEFAGSRFKQNPEEEAQFAFFLSERMAQLGVKNVVKAYTDKYGQDSLKVYDIYAQNFKINKIMQDYVAQKTMEVYDRTKDAYNQIDSLPVGSYNAQAGGKGGFHTMFDTMGAVGAMKTASKGYIPNFAELQQAKVLRFGPQVRDLSIQQYEAQQSGGKSYTTGLRGTSFDEETAKNDIAASILGPNYFLPDEDFASTLIAKFGYNKIGETSTMFGMMPQMKRDGTSFVQGKVSGKVRELKYEKLGKVFDTIAKNRGMESIWNQILEKKSQTGREDRRKISEDVRALVSQFRPVVIDELTKRLREQIIGFTTQIPRHDAEFLAFGEQMELGPDGKLSEKDEAKVKKIQEKQKYFMSLGLPEELQRESKSVLDRIVLKDPTQKVDPSLQGFESIYLRTQRLSGALQRITDKPEYFWGDWKKVQEELNQILPAGPQSDFVKKYINNNYDYDQVKKRKIANPNIQRLKKILYTLKQYGMADWDNIDFPASIAKSAHSGYIPNFSEINPNDLNFARKLTGKDAFGIYREILASTKKANEPVGSLEFKELLYPDSKGNLSFNVDFIKVREKFRGKGMSSLLYEEMFKQTKEIGEEKKRAGEKIAGVKIMGEAVEQTGSRPFPQIYTREKAGEKFGAKTDILDPISGKPLPKNLQQEILKGNKNSGASSFPVDSIMQLAYSGFVPNFADGPLMDAIQREKLESGLPLSAISVVRDGRLKNSQNPNGLAVINSRDEPNGKIPNFAETWSPEKIAAFEEAIGRLVTYTGNLNDAIEKVAKNIEVSSETINKGVENFLKDLPVIQGVTDRPPKPQEKPPENPDKEVAKAKKEEKKTVQDSLYSLLKWQTFLSFTSGALSKFGDNVAKVGEGLSSLGTAVLSTTEGYNAIKQITIGDKRSISESFSLAGRVSRRAATRAEREGGGIVEQGLAAAKGFFKGGGLKAIGAATGVVGVGIVAAIEAFNGIDKTLQSFIGSVERSSTTLSSLNEMQQKYGVTLSETQKNLVALSSSAVGSGTAISGFLNKLGIAALNPFSTKTEDLVQKNFGSTGLTTEANKSLFSTIASIRAPQIELAMKEAQKEKTGKSLEEIKIPSALLVEEIQKQSSEILERARQNLVDKAQKERGPVIESFTQGNEVGESGFVPKEGTKEYEERLKLEKERLKNELDIADVLREIDSILENQSDISRDLVARAKEYQDSFLYSTKYLQSQLNYSSELLKIQNSISSSEQTLLRFRKENVQTSEAEKMLIDYKLQKLEAEKNLRSDIQQSVLDTAKQEINQFISNRGGKLNEEEAKRVSELYEKLASTPATTGGIAEVFNKFVTDLLKVAPENQKWIENLNSIGKGLQLTVDLQEKRFAVSQQELQTQTLLSAINAKISNEYDAQKQFLNNKISIQQKGLEIAKEELDISRQIRDAKFERSLVGLSPRRQELKRIERGLSGIELSDKLTDIKTRRAQAGLGVRSNLMQAILEQDKTIEPMSLEGMSQGDLQKKFVESFNTKGSQLNETIDKIQTEALTSFPSSVSEAGDIFKIKAKEAGEELAKSWGVDPIKQPTKFGAYPQGLPQTGEDKGKAPEKNEPAAPIKVPDDVQTKLDEARKREQANKEARAQTALKEILSKGALPKNLEQGAQEDATTLADKLLDQKDKLTTFRGGFRASLQEIDDEIDGFRNKLGKQIPTDFRNGLVDAMKALSDPNATTSLKERLMGVAAAFLNKINESLMTNFANKITQGIFGSGQFGESKGIFPMSTGGEISKGSGYKDDVPAMLMKGEYVVKKSAVSKYGKDFLDKLNRGKVQGYANGGIVGFEEANRKDLAINPNNYTPYGQVRSGNLIFDESGKVSGLSNYTGKEQNREDAIKRAQSDFYAAGAQSGMGGFFTPGTYGQGAIMGQRNLLAFATQGAAGTQFDVMRGGGGAASIDIAGGSANLSLFGLRNQENLRNVEYLDSQKKALDLYLGQIGAEKEKFQKEEEARKQIEEFKKKIAEEAKAQRRAIIGQVISTVAMAAISAGIKSFSSGMSSAKQAAELKNEKLSTFGAIKGGFTGGTFNGETRGGLFNILGSSGFKDFSVVGANVAGFQGDGLAKFDSASGKYIKMDPYEFGARYGSLNYAGKLGYDQLGSPVRNDFSSGGMGSGFSLSKLNPMNWFRSSGSSVGSVANRSSGLNFGNMGFGDGNLGGDVTYFEDRELMIDGKFYRGPIQVNPNGDVNYLRKGIWTTANQIKQPFAAGGYVAGNGMGDNVPAMLNGGEFVISKQAAQNIGYNNLQAMNAGAGGGSNEIATRIELKLQELVEKVAGVGTINISVESGKGGGENQSGANESASNQESQNRDLARKIKDVVINVIREEKRLGGMLR